MSPQEAFNSGKISSDEMHRLLRRNDIALKILRSNLTLNHSSSIQSAFEMADEFIKHADSKILIPEMPETIDNPAAL